MAKKKSKTKKIRLTTYGEFLVLLPCCVKSHVEELREKLSAAKRPAYIGGRETPSSLNMITYGQLDDLSRISENDDPAVKVFSILLEMESIDVYQLNVFDVFGFVNFCKDEVNRINKLFASIIPSRSTEELAAGVEELNFGTFGVVDWYARRMGITDQDEVYRVPWIRIFTCMKNDNEQAEYEKRLNKQYINNMKLKHRR